MTRLEIDGETVLFAWISPSFPIGSFAYSHGLETAVDDGDIHDAVTLAGWLAGLAAYGSIRNDAILASAAWTAAEGGDGKALADVNELALALAPSRERYLEAAAQGNAFVAAIRAAWPDANCAFWPDGDIAYPVGFGSACATMGISLAAARRALTFGAVQNLVSAAVRLSVIGQTDAQRTIAGLLPRLSEIIETLAHATLDDVGGCAFRSDLASLRHETQYSRLFRS